MSGRKKNEHSKYMCENNPKAQKVSINGVTYDTIKIAAQELNMSRSSVKYRLNSEDDKYNIISYLCKTNKQRENGRKDKTARDNLHSSSFIGSPMHRLYGRIYRPIRPFCRHQRISDDDIHLSPDSRTLLLVQSRKNIKRT